jgi:hypothetical protein
MGTGLSPQWVRYGWVIVADTLHAKLIPCMQGPRLQRAAAAGGVDRRWIWSSSWTTDRLRKGLTTHGDRRAVPDTLGWPQHHRRRLAPGDG